jgi:hypothetical protein
MKAEKVFVLDARLKKSIGPAGIPEWAVFSVNMSDPNELSAFVKANRRGYRGQLQRFANSRSVIFEFEEDATAWYIKYA